MATMNDILQEVVDSHRDTDVLMNIHTMHEHLSMSDEDKKFLDLRLAFLVRHIKDLEFKATT